MEGIEIRSHQTVGRWKKIMKLKCELDGQSCVLPKYIAKFILNATLMYCGSLDASNSPRIQPTIFTNEAGKCNIAFLVHKGSSLARNIQKHPNITFSTDQTHQTDPSQNTGIMIETVSRAIFSPEEVSMCFDNLQEKYGVDEVTKIMGINIPVSYIKIEAFPTKIVYWKGPFFKRFICKQSKKRSKLLKREKKIDTL